MLNRQKTLLNMLRLAGRPVSRMELTKWAFLLRHETESGGGSAFYDFVPYQYGPFSFSLYQESGKLRDQNYLVEVGETAWQSGEVSSPDLPDKDVQADVEKIVGRFKSYSREKLLDYVYQEFPSFTVNSKRKQLQKRSEAPLAVYTAGYEGLSIDGFLNRLVNVGIRHLIDVRMNPIARRYGFHRSTLSRLCGSLGIEYTHEPRLGIQSDKRRNLETQGDYDALFRDYRATTLKSEKDAIQSVADMVVKSPSVLVCMEAEPCCCHRSHLADSVSRITRLPIEHITSG